MKNRTRFFLIVAAVFLVACNSNSTPPEKLAELVEKGGKYYNNGNYQEAVKWYKKAADQGYAEAQYK